jgi:hypothetical protein
MVHKPEDHIEFIIESLTRVNFIRKYLPSLSTILYSIKMEIKN